MAKSSYDKYYEDLYASGKGSVSAQETALKNAAQKEKDLINQTAEEEINAITEDYNSSVADVNQQYEDAFKRNATQRALNERYLERKSAEMGLTDSGLNRTQMTANQLSYANQNANLDAGLIKDVNALSAAMKARKLETEQKRRSDLAAVNANKESAVSKLWADYDTSVRSSAEDWYKADVEESEKSAKALENLMTILSRSDDEDDADYLSRDMKESYVENYINQYGISPALENLLSKFKYTVEAPVQSTTETNDEFDWKKPFRTSTTTTTTTPEIIEKAYSTDYFANNAYNNLLKNYMLNPKLSKQEKINRFVDMYGIYGMPSDDIIRALKNAPNSYLSGISMNDLYKAIKEAYGE